MAHVNVHTYFWVCNYPNKFESLAQKSNDHAKFCGETILV
jgi:hypothetical protein